MLQVSSSNIVDLLGNSKYYEVLFLAVTPEVGVLLCESI